MSLKDIFKLYGDSFICHPAKWVWLKIHSVDFIDNYIGHLLSITIIMFFYALIIYLVWCLLAGVFDVLTYNKRRTVELQGEQKNKANIREAAVTWEQLRSDLESGIAVPDPMYEEMFGANRDPYEMLLEATAEQHGISVEKLKKMMK